MKFSVKYSIQKDINNHLNSIWRFKYRKYGRKKIKERLLSHYPDDLKQKLAQTKTKQEAKKIIKNSLLNFKESIFRSVEKVNQILNKNKEEIVFSLEKVYRKKLPFKEVKVYLTTAPIFPYNYDHLWFMTGKNCSAEKHISIAKHELNHFMFYYYFADDLKKKGQTNKVIEEIKEALAILTSSEDNNKPSIKNMEKVVLKNKERKIGEIVDILIRLRA